MSNAVFAHYPTVILVPPRGGGRGKGEQRRLCAHCDQTYSLGTSITILRDHIDLKHPGALTLHALPPLLPLPPPPPLRLSLLRRSGVPLSPSSTAALCYSTTPHCAPPSPLSSSGAPGLTTRLVYPEFIDFVAAVRSSNYLPPDRRQLRERRSSWRRPSVPAAFVSCAATAALRPSLSPSTAGPTSTPRRSPTSSSSVAASPTTGAPSSTASAGTPPSGWCLRSLV